MLVLPAGTPGAPSVSQAAALAVRRDRRPGAGPRPDGSQRRSSATSSATSTSPTGRASFGWRAVGQRSDRIGGRLALTVYYGWRGHRVAYTIVDAPALAQPSASVTRLHGAEYRTLMVGGRQVVTWRRDNHTCVLSADGVPRVGPAAARRLAGVAPGAPRPLAGARAHAVYGTPPDGGAAWEPVNFVIAPVVEGSVVSGPPNRTILPLRIWPISAPP